MYVKDVLALIKRNEEWIAENPVYIDGVKERLKQNKELRDILEELGSIQDECLYGYILPDRCRYKSNTGCDCGAYGKK